MDLQIVPVATLREESGLALSSRNQRLSAEEKKLAPLIFRRLREGSSAEIVRSALAQDGLQVDYVTDFQGRRFVAARLGEVRLIDNVLL